MKQKKRSKKSNRPNTDDDEEQHLLIDHDTVAPDNNNQPVSKKPGAKSSKQRSLRRMDSKVNMFAPEARDTFFEDVPVMTICPHCRAKVVTKTSFSKKKSCCFCCCTEEMLSMFKPIKHCCPKCNQRIAKYNRFGFNFKSHQTIYEHTEKTQSREDVTTTGEETENEEYEVTRDKQQIQPSNGGGMKANRGNSFVASEKADPSRANRKMIKKSNGKTARHDISY